MRRYLRSLDKQRLGQLIDLIGNIGLGSKADRSKDILGRVYEYFLSKFASAEGKKGGQFYTPPLKAVVLQEWVQAGLLITVPTKGGTRKSSGSARPVVWRTRPGHKHCCR